MPTESGSSGEHPAGTSTSARESCTPDPTNCTQAGKIMRARGRIRRCAKDISLLGAL
jgi:hypothetical protein